MLLQKYLCSFFCSSAYKLRRYVRAVRCPLCVCWWELFRDEQLFITTQCYNESSSTNGIHWSFETYKCFKNWVASVHIMACRLFSANSLPESIMFCQLNLKRTLRWNQISVIVPYCLNNISLGFNKRQAITLTSNDQGVYTILCQLPVCCSIWKPFAIPKQVQTRHMNIDDFGIIEVYNTCNHSFKVNLDNLTLKLW